MPYIKQEQRGTFYAPDFKDAGHLNYFITKALISYMQQHGLRYQTLNDCLGALEGAKLELQRRIIGPYENEKIVENGDVYPSLESLKGN